MDAFKVELKRALRPAVKEALGELVREELAAILDGMVKLPKVLESDPKLASVTSDLKDTDIPAKQSRPQQLLALLVRRPQSLIVLRDRLGMSTKQVHSAAQYLRKTGKAKSAGRGLIRLAK